MTAVHVWPARDVPGWRGPQDDERAYMADAVDLRTALTRRWATWAQAALYRLPDGAGYSPVAPRINKSGAAILTEQGEEPQVVLVAVDIDTDEHIAWTDGGSIKGLPPHHVDAVEALALMYPDAVVYSSKGGARLLWVLSRPVPARYGDALVAWAMGTVPNHDPRAGGWNRCFGLPYVTRPGESFEPHINLTALDRGDVLDVPDLATLTETVPKLHREVEVTMGTRPGDDELADLWAAIHSTSKAGKIEHKARTGAPIAAPGGRNEVLFSVVRSLLVQLSRSTEGQRVSTQGSDAIAAWLAPRVYWMLHDSVKGDITPDAPTLDDLWSMVERSIGIEVEDMEQTHAAELHAQEDQPDADYHYDPDDPDTPVLLLHGASSYYVRDCITGAWAGPTGRDGLPTLCRMHQPSLLVTSTKGAPHSAGRILMTYGTVVRSVAYTYGEQQGYDPDTSTLYLCSCHRLPVAAVHHPEIAVWLRALFGEHVDKGERWLATVGRTEDPTCALYLEGPKGIGKGLLARGIAKLWGSKPTSFNHAIGRWNSVLTDCPLVFLDEDGGGLSRRASGAFRSLITEGDYTVEAKHQAPSRLRGYPRVLIAANNPDALGLATGHTQADVDAIVERLWHIRADDAAERYLNALGGMAYTKDEAHWLERPDGSPGLLCEHLAWLEATVQVQRTGRLLVAGVDPAYQRRIIGSSEENSELLYAVAMGLLNNLGNGPSQVKGLGIRPRPDSAQGAPPVVWCNAKALHSRWGSLVQEDVAKPKASAVARTLRDVSQDTDSTVLRVDGSTTRAWSIDPLLVIEAAEAYGLDGVNALRRALGVAIDPFEDDAAPVMVGNRAT